MDRLYCSVISSHLWLEYTYSISSQWCRYLLLYANNSPSFPSITTLIRIKVQWTQVYKINSKIYRVVPKMRICIGHLLILTCLTGRKLQNNYPQSWHFIEVTSRFLFWDVWMIYWWCFIFRCLFGSRTLTVRFCRSEAGELLYTDM